MMGHMTYFLFEPHIAQPRDPAVSKFFGLRTYNREIVKNQKFGNLAVFLWEEKIDVSFVLKTLIMPIFREIEEGGTGK
jgi:hypothetical protein